MGWSVIPHAEIGVVETIYTGLMSIADLEAAVKETLSVASRLGTSLLLSDCTGLIGGHSSADLYFLAKAIRELPGSATIREAMLLPALPQQQKEAMFWETTATNRGLVVRLFADRQAALNWLAEHVTQEEA
jgi:hypothetical protein